MAGGFMTDDALEALEEQIRDNEAEEGIAEDIQAQKEGWDSAHAKHLHESLARFIEDGGFDGDPDDPNDNFNLED